MRPVGREGPAPAPLSAPCGPEGEVGEIEDGVDAVEAPELRPDPGRVFLSHEPAAPLAAWASGAVRSLPEPGRLSRENAAEVLELAPLVAEAAGDEDMAANG